MARVRFRLSALLVGAGRRWRALAGASALSALAAAAMIARADAAQTPLYAGKEIRMVVGSGPGGGVDAYARVFAAHLVDHIPGRPAIVVEDMPGAIGVVAMNWIYNSAPRDGTSILSSSNVAPAAPLFGDRAAQYDPRKLVSIGSISPQQSICATWRTSPIKTLAQAKQKAVVVAADAPNSQSATMPLILNTLFGTKFKVVTGYSTSDLAMALERGEAEGVCGLSWSTLKAAHPDWIKNNMLHVLAQTGDEPQADLPRTPLLVDMTSNPEDKRMLRLLNFPGEIGRPFFMPPQSPGAMVAVMRAAFDATMKDPAFLAQASKAMLEVDPLSGAAMARVIAQAYATPKALVKRAEPFSGFQKR